MELTLVQKIAIWALPVLFAITVHEVAHGWVASKFGDQTARLAGRLTLNPFKHIDLIGTIIVPLMLLMVSNFIFGWAKPVPVDARNLRHPRYHMALVAAAGPIANFLMALFWAAIAKLGINLNAWFGVPLIYMGQAGMMINIVLGVLNCLPLPPLDGGRVLYNLLPGRMGFNLYRIEPYGFLILVLLMLSGILSYVIAPIVFGLLNMMTMLFGL
ncbi:MAG: peptidase M50 [uncultured bacterium]|nr:MAG: peptidase M50 [uncultured bacterium]